MTKTINAFQTMVELGRMTAPLAAKYDEFDFSLEVKENGMGRISYMPMEDAYIIRFTIKPEVIELQYIKYTVDGDKRVTPFTADSQAEFLELLASLTQGWK